MKSRTAAAAATAVDVGANVLASIAAARVLGPAGSAPLALGLSVAGLLSVVTFLGAGEVSTTLLSQGVRSRASVYSAARTIAWRGSVRVAVGVIVAILATRADLRAAACIIVSAATLALAGHSAVGQHVIWALDAARGDLRDVMISRVVFLGGVALALASGAGAIGASSAYLLQALVLLVLRTSRARRLVLTHPGGADRIDADELARLGRPLGIAVVLSTLASRLDVVLLGRFAPSEIGFFAAAQRLTAAGQTAAQAFAGALLPEMSRDAAAGRLRLGRRALVLSGTGFAVGVGMAVAAPFVIEVVYGPAFAPATPMLRWLALALGFQWSWAFGARALIAAGGAARFPRLQVVSLACQVVAKPVLVFFGGATGAAASIFLADGLLFATGTRALVRQLRPTVPARDSSRIPSTVAASAA